MVIGPSIFYLYMDLTLVDFQSMKNVLILLLILLSANVYPQTKIDSLLNTLDTVSGEKRIDGVRALWF